MPAWLGCCRHECNTASETLPFIYLLLHSQPTARRPCSTAARFRNAILPCHTSSCCCPPAASRQHPAHLEFQGLRALSFPSRLLLEGGVRCSHARRGPSSSDRKGSSLLCPTPVGHACTGLPAWVTETPLSLSGDENKRKKSQRHNGETRWHNTRGALVSFPSSSGICVVSSTQSSALSLIFSNQSFDHPLRPQQLTGT